tara:strand:+ start:907 stop:1053 length:147 start_codon:yes stop_codon:yes gene_type:complete
MPDETEVIRSPAAEAFHTSQQELTVIAVNVYSTVCDVIDNLLVSEEPV